MKIFGCGDLYITKRLPEKGYQGFDRIRSLIKEHDVCFGNLEVTVHNNEGYPSFCPGGSWAFTRPISLVDLKRFGFNILNIGNNHTMDFSHGGLEATINYLNKEAIPFVGAGLNLSDASKPKYIECFDRTRVAVIGTTSSFNVMDAAGFAGGCMKGRPGVNPLRRSEMFELNAESFEALREIIRSIKIKDTYRFPDCEDFDDNDMISFRGTSFFKGNVNRRVSKINQSDLERMLVSIEEASVNADCTIVSFHSHQMSGEYERPHEFIIDFCHKCIDAGAHIVFGHGVHSIRGMEIYKGFPIFYGLGDFIFQNETMDMQPYQFYNQLNTDAKYLEMVGIGMKSKSKDDTVGLNADSRTWESIAVSLDFECGKVNEIRIYPITLGFKNGRIYRGWPNIDDSTSILKRFSELSNKHFNTNILFKENTIQFINAD